MFFHAIVMLFMLPLAVLGQANIAQLNMEQLLPQQRILAERYLTQTQSNSNAIDGLMLDNQGIERVETVDEPQEESPKANAAEQDSAPSLNLSAIERDYRDVDTDHAVQVMHGVTVNASPALRQFGYDFFKHQYQSNGNTAAPSNYQLQSGDFFTLFIYGKKEQILELSVDNEGAIFIPNIGPIVVAGLTLSEANKKVTNALKKRYVNFDTQLKLNALKPVMVLISGHVGQPGTYSVNKFESVFSVLSKAGGVKKSGSLRYIKVLSPNGKKRQIDLYSYVLTDKAMPAMNFNEGDVVVVPAIGPTVAIGGAVNTPGIFELGVKTTLADVVNYGGGPAMNAYLNDVYVNGFNGRFSRQVKSISGQSRSAVMAKLAETPANNGDIIMINKKPNIAYGYVNILGNVKVPGKVAFNNGLTLGALLKQAKGVKENTHPTVHVFRYASDDHRELLRTKLTNTEFRIQDQDVVAIYNQRELIEPQRISIIGEVLSPGDYTYFDKMTLSDAILLAKPTAMASMYAVEVARSSGKKAALHYVNQSDMATFQLTAGDRISVKKDSLKDQMATITLSGEVLFPGEYKVAKGTRLAEVIQRAGGFTDSAYVKGAVFTRVSVKESDKAGHKKVVDDEQKRFIYDQTHLGNLSMDSQVSMGIMMTARKEALDYLDKKVGAISGRVIIDLNRDNFVGSADNFRVQDGDTLTIPTAPESVHLIGGVQQGISIAHNPSYSLHDYIHHVGGFSKYADKRNIYIFKSSGRVFQNSNVIEPGDIVYVPERVVISFNWLQFLTNITSIVSNAVTSIALVKSLQ
ncbi:MAG: SLBB domain-containing protein [Candidatus Margulisbacteria bacterium]|nr:SLBB domain-containing protein [Candidatus Margulisiibacteriota bacterium]